MGHINHDEGAVFELVGVGNIHVCRKVLSLHHWPKTLSFAANCVVEGSFGCGPSHLPASRYVLMWSQQTVVSTVGPLFPNSGVLNQHQSKLWRCSAPMCRYLIQPGRTSTLHLG